MGTWDGKAFEKTAVCLFVYYRVFAPVFDCKSLLGKIIILYTLGAAARLFQPSFHFKADPGKGVENSML